MPERWEHELRKLRNLDAPEDLRGRALAGPRSEPGRPPRERFVAAAVALAVFGVAGLLALRTFGATQPATDGTPSVSTDAVVIELTGADAPSATIRFGDDVLDAVDGGYEWCESGACVAGAPSFAFYPPVTEYVVAPPGSPIEVRGDGMIRRFSWTVVDLSTPAGVPIEFEGSTVPSENGVYALEVEATWDAGSANFFFGVQALSSVNDAPDVLGVDCSGGGARVDTAVVRTQRDGLHVSFSGTDGYRAFGIVAPEGAPEGFFGVGGSLPERGDRAWGVPPGRWEVGCGGDVSPGDGAAPFELIDPDDHAAPDLTCEDATDEPFTSTVTSSTPHGDAAASIVAGLANGDRLREGGYGAETFKLGPTYVVDRNGEAVARLVLSGNAPTYAGTLTTCPGSGITLSMAATGEVPPIVVTSPRPGDAVTSPVTIAGTADVFEATVSIRIVDAVGNVVAETFTTATCGTGCRGEFSTQVPFAVAEEQAGEIVVYEASAQDGGPINEVRIPVTLLPGDNLEDARAFVGRWTDDQGQSVPEDVLTVYFGAEHCSWGDIVFLRLGTNARTDQDAPTYIRDTTGELADLSRGTWAIVRDLPRGAAFAGIRTGAWELWTDPSDPDAVFLVNGDSGRIERWPALESAVACD
jgi:Immunoglobulin-like domain of bacterial spore germination